MSVAKLISDLGARGVRLSANGDKIHFKGNLNDIDRQALKNNKAAILKLLSTEPNAPCSQCNYKHYWLSDDGWLCNRCNPRPDDLLGSTICVPGGEGPLDDPLAPEPLEPAPVTTAPPTDVNTATVLCGDCKHFIRDHINPPQGIGQCDADAWRPGRPPLYPMTSRRCDQFVRITP